jgi:HEPN domain-containing protein
MKALLIDRRAPAPKTHDLVQLHQLVRQVEPSWIWDEQELDWLGRAAVTYRYPGNTATKVQARKAMRLCEQLRETLRGLIS